MMAARRQSSAPPRKETPGPSRALVRRLVGGGLEEAFDPEYVVVPLAATCACAHRRSQRSRGVLGGLTDFGSVRVAGESCAGPRLASEGGFHGCDGQNVLLKFRSAGVRLRRGCST